MICSDSLKSQRELKPVLLRVREQLNLEELISQVIEGYIDLPPPMGLVSASLTQILSDNPYPYHC